MFLLLCMCVVCVYPKKRYKNGLPPLPKQRFSRTITKNLSFSKSRFSFCFLLNLLKTNSKIELGPRADRNSPPSNRVRSEFRRGQTPKQLDSAATAVMTLAVAATTAAALWIHRNSSRTAGTRTSSPGCPPEKEGGSGGGSSSELPPVPIRCGHPRCRRSGSSTFRAPSSP